MNRCVNYSVVWKRAAVHHPGSTSHTDRSGSPADQEARTRSTPPALAVTQAHDRPVDSYFILSPQDHGAGEVTQLFCCTNNHDDSDELPEETRRPFFPFITDTRSHSATKAPGMQIRTFAHRSELCIRNAVRERRGMNVSRSAFFIIIFFWLHTRMTHRGPQQLHNLHVVLFNINVSELMWMKAGI